MLCKHCEAGQHELYQVYRSFSTVDDMAEAWVWHLPVGLGGGSGSSHELFNFHLHLPERARGSATVSSRPPGWTTAQYCNRKLFCGVLCAELVFLLLQLILWNMEQIEINFTFSKQASGSRKMLVLQAAATTANQLTTDSDGRGGFLVRTWKCNF